MTLPRDVNRDDDLAVALERHLAEAHPIHPGDVSALHLRIVQGATSRPAALRRDAALWELASRARRVAIPFGIAAGLVGLLVATRGPVPAGMVAELVPARAVAETPAGSAADSLTWAAVGPAGQGSDVSAQLMGPITVEWLLSAAINQ
jgi:hypothetical protein